MGVIRCETCERNIDLDFDSTHIEDCKWEADGQPEEEQREVDRLLNICKAALTELLTEHRIFVEATERYIAAHSGIRARFQDADLAEEYTCAGQALERLLETSYDTGERE